MHKGPATRPCNQHHEAPNPKWLVQAEVRDVWIPIFLGLCELFAMYCRERQSAPYTFHHQYQTGGKGPGRGVSVKWRRATSKACEERDSGWSLILTGLVINILHRRFHRCDWLTKHRLPFTSGDVVPFMAHLTTCSTFSPKPCRAFLYLTKMVDSMQYYGESSRQDHATASLSTVPSDVARLYTSYKWTLYLPLHRQKRFINIILTF